MAAEDYIDEFNFGGHYSRRSEPVCNRCGSSAVHWKRIGLKFRLTDNRTGEPHACSVDTSKLFDDLGETDA